MNVMRNCIVILCMVSSATTQTWIGLGSFEYYVSRDTVKHSDAVESCEARNGYLVVISSDRIQNFLVQEIATSEGGKPHKTTDINKYNI